MRPLCSVLSRLILILVLVAPADRAGAEATAPVPHARSQAAFVSPSLEAQGGLDVPLGGDDVVVVSGLAGGAATPYRTWVEVSSAGDVYVAIATEGGTTPRTRIYRAVGGDKSFNLWGSRNEVIKDFHLAEGTVDRVFIAHGDVGGVFVARSDINQPAASWSDWIVVGNEFGSYAEIDIATDDASFAGYYVYVIASQLTPGLTGDGADLYFARSVNQGNTYESEYVVAANTDGGGGYQGYVAPSIAFSGTGGVEVVFRAVGQGMDDGLFSIHASSWANAGAAAWSAPVTLNPRNDGLYFRPLPGDLEASLTGTLLFSVQPVDALGSDVGSPEVWWSTDRGSTWPASQRVALGTGESRGRGDLTLNAAGTVGFAGDASVSAATLQSAARTTTLSNLSTWGGFEPFADETSTTGGAWIAAATAASYGGRRAWAWSSYENSDWVIRFDAEWFRDSGYPNFESGFPLAVPGGGQTPPAVANLDDDPQLEIVFATLGGQVYVVNHDGTVAPGWPVNVGVLNFDVPVAVGDLNGDGKNEIAVGNDAGIVHVLDGEGNPRPGWPVDLGTGRQAWVSMGGPAPPHHRAVVALSGESAVVLDHRGGESVRENFVGFSTGSFFGRPAAIGDVDEDFVAEVVFHKGEWAFVMDLGTGTVEGLRQFVGVSFSDAATLGDVDGDGPLEIALPTTTGSLYLTTKNLVDMSGWPISPTFSDPPLTSAMLVDLVGNGFLEVAFAEREVYLHATDSDGVPLTGFPRQIGNLEFQRTAFYMPPIVAHVTSGSPDFVTPSDFSRPWAVETTGSTIPGWPKELGDVVEQSPAAADIDLDGRLEVVVLGLTQLFVIDTGGPEATNPRSRWPMYGYDAARTGCLDCPVNLATSVEGVPQVSSVQFAPSWPNPASSQAFFRYRLPEDAVVRLDVYDVRGQRVRTIVDGVQAAGEYQSAWDGRDGNGRSVAQGVYHARLVVDGEQSVELVRKVTLVR